MFCTDFWTQTLIPIGTVKFIVLSLPYRFSMPLERIGCNPVQQNGKTGLHPGSQNIESKAELKDVQMK